MQRWVSFVLLLAFIRLQLVCCCGSVGICCETSNPGVQERAPEVHTSAKCSHDHHHAHQVDVAVNEFDASHHDSDQQESPNRLRDEWETVSHDDHPHSQSHFFYLSDQNQIVLGERTDFRNVTQPVASSTSWIQLSSQRTVSVLEYRWPRKHQQSIFDLVGHLRI